MSEQASNNLREALNSLVSLYDRSTEMENFSEAWINAIERAKDVLAEAQSPPRAGTLVLASELAQKYLMRRDNRFHHESYMPECRTELVELLLQFASATALTGRMVIKFDSRTGSTHMTDREQWGELMAEQINSALAAATAPLGLRLTEELWALHSRMRCKHVDEGNSLAEYSADCKKCQLERILRAAATAERTPPAMYAISGVAEQHSIESDLEPPMLSQQDYDNLIRDAILWRKQQMTVGDGWMSIKSDWYKELLAASHQAFGRGLEAAAQHVESYDGESLAGEIRALQEPDRQPPTPMDNEEICSHNIAVGSCRECCPEIDEPPTPDSVQQREQCAFTRGRESLLKDARVDIEWVNDALLFAGEDRTNTIKPDLLANAINKHFALVIERALKDEPPASAKPDVSAKEPTK